MITVISCPPGYIFLEAIRELIVPLDNDLQRHWRPVFFRVEAAPPPPPPCPRPGRWANGFAARGGGAPPAARWSRGTPGDAGPPLPMPSLTRAVVGGDAGPPPETAARRCWTADVP